MTGDLQVVFGTGPIGLGVIEELAAQGHRVRAVNRSGQTPLPAGVETAVGDASDPGFATTAAAGAAVVYQCLNPPYTEWPERFPPLQAAVLTAAEAAGAKLVALENLYMYGSTGGRPITEDLPFAATGPKGATRARMAEELQAAHRAGRVRVTTGRASDYFGPRGLASAAGGRMFPPILAGKKAQVMGDPGQLHSYTYLPDIARGLVTLAGDDRADGAAWHLPNAPAVTTREFVAAIEAAAGTEGGVSAMPRLVLSVVGLFNGSLREMKEMLYEFEEPYVVDSTKFEQTFGWHATPLAESIPATVEWFRDRAKG
jgi:nucleoside-diphosphate-sugar epimerase